MGRVFMIFSIKIKINPMIWKINNSKYYFEVSSWSENRRSCNRSQQAVGSEIGNCSIWVITHLQFEIYIVLCTLFTVEYAASLRQVKRRRGPPRFAVLMTLILPGWFCVYLISLCRLLSLPASGVVFSTRALSPACQVSPFNFILSFLIFSLSR